MGRFYICPKTGLKRGAWTPEEDSLLAAYVKRYGHCNWRELPKYAGLSRCGKSCRLRWLNYLRPSVKRGNYTREEDELIIKLHEKIGNKWSVIAASLPGRTDNEIKNHWHCHLKRHITQNATTKERKKRPNSVECVITSEGNDVLLPSTGSSALLPPLPQTSTGTSSLTAVSGIDSSTSFEAIFEFESSFWSVPFEMDDFYLEGETSVPFSPTVGYETTSEANSVIPYLEAPTLVPLSPSNSSNSSSSALVSGEESLLSSKPIFEFDRDFWSEPYHMDDLFMQEHPPQVSLPSALGESLYPYDFYNGYDTDILFNH